MLQTETTETSPPSSAETPRHALRKIGWLRAIVPLVVFLTLVGAVGLLWVSEVERAKAEVAIQTRSQTRQIAQRARNLINAELAKVRDLAHELGTLDRLDMNRFVAAVGRSIKSSLSIRHVEWIPLNKKLLVAQDFSSPPPSDFPLAKDPKDIKDSKEPKERKITEPWGYTLNRAAATRAARVAAIEPRSSHVDLWAIIPAISGEGKDQGYLGSVAVRMDLSAALRDLEGAEPLQGRDVVVESRGLFVYSRGGPINSADEQIDRETVPVLDRTLQLSVRTDPETVVTGRASATWILILGLPVALGLAGAVWHVLTVRARTAAEARWQIDALEELTQAAGAVSTDMAAGQGALDQLAGSARRLLGMKMACISLVDLAAGKIELVARDGLQRNHRTLFSIEEGKGTLACFHSGQTMVVEDTRIDPRVNSKVLADLYGIVSVLLVPLAVGGKPIGVMYIGNDKPRRYSPTEVRLAGVLGAQAGVFLAILKLLREKEEAYSTQQQLSSQRESLYQIAGEIYLNEDLPQSLQRLADATPAVIGVDLCVVGLRTGRGNEIQIYAVTGDIGGVKGERHDVSGGHTEEAWATRAPVIIEDGPSDAKLLPALRHRLHVGSMALLPLLRTDRKPIGVLGLIRSKPSTFTRQQLDLATVIAARAATAIEKARLYSSARRLASSRETLLRELNHRVKNNLSSIVTLLEVNRPNLSEHAKRWLNRVTGRVSTMARTHDLFVGGTASVSLGDLVSKLMPSLSVVKPPRSHIVTQIQAPEIRLPTDRAVSLAMVLNELCWNALEHGVGEEGILHVRTQRIGENRLVIEVEDDGGRRKATPQPLPDHTEPGSDLLSTRRPRGMGLSLVEGLVSRELGGKFVLIESDGGGTLAQVDLPILDEGGNSEESAVADGGAVRLN